MHLQDLYKNIFPAPSSVMPDYAFIHETIPNLVSGEDNLSLTMVLDYIEIRQTIFDMDPLSASGLDGFTSKFFHHC